MTPNRSLFLLLPVPFLLSACNDSTTDPSEPGSGQARVEVRITDAPSDYVASAEVTVTRVYLVPSGGDAVDLLPEGETPTYDLLTLRDGVDALLAVSPVPVNDYHQLRIRVQDPVVTLKEGYTFRDGSTTKALKVPSGETSGIKVLLSEPVPAVEGMVTVVVVDFDVDDNFRIQGNPDTPAGIQGMSFLPVLKEKSRALEEDDEDGTIGGEDDDDEGDFEDEDEGDVGGDDDEGDTIGGDEDDGEGDEEGEDGDTIGGDEDDDGSETIGG